MRCAALGFGVGATLCFLFCYCSFGGIIFGGGVEMNLLGDTLVNEVSDGSNRLLGYDGASMSEENLGIQQQLQSRNKLLWHAVSAILLQSALCFLEPSLKSLLSLSLSSSKNRTKARENKYICVYLVRLGVN